MSDTLSLINRLQKQMADETHQSRLTLFLTRDAKARIADLERTPGWSEVARWITASSEETTVPTSTVIQASAIVCAYQDALKAYQQADPSRMDRLTAGCQRWEGLQAATSQMEQIWEASGASVAVLLDAIAENSALDAVSSATGSKQWADTSSLQNLSTELRSLDAEEPVPPGMPCGLVEMLQAPAQQCPGSLAGQLEWIGKSWSAWVSEDFSG